MGFHWSFVGLQSLSFVSRCCFGKLRSLLLRGEYLCSKLITFGKVCIEEFSGFLLGVCFLFCPKFSDTDLLLFIESKPRSIQT